MTPTPRTDYHQHHRDTHRRRSRDAVSVMTVARRHFSLYPRLYAYRLDLPPGPLYGPQAHGEARALVNQTLSSAVGHWKLEGIPGGRRHVHITTPLPPRAVPAALHAASVWHLPGWLAYLAKPADPRLCRPGPLTPYSPDPYSRARAYRDALEEYATARRDALEVGRRRLSPLSGWVGTRRAIRPRASLLVVLAVARYVVALALSTPQDRAPLPSPCPALPLAPLEALQHRERPLRPPLPPPRIQAQAR